MSEFTEKLNSSELVSKAWDEIDRDQANAGLLIDVIKSEFKDWQPPKELVEVPQRFADWFEEKNVASFLSVVSAYSFSDDEDIKWVRDNGGLDLLCKMKLYGYTVEKEVYILKHIDLSKNDKEKDWYLAKKVTGKLYHSWGEKGREHKGMIEGMYFTQSEIDKLNTGSYEQIAV